MTDDWRALAKQYGASIGPVKLITELPDGDRIEVTDPEIVPMGDVFAHRQLSYVRDGDDGRPACEIVFEIRDGVPICQSIRLWSTPYGKSYVRAKDLTGIKLDNVRDDVYAYAGVLTRNPAGGWMRKLGPASFLQDRKRVERATERRKLTPEFLSRVAELYNRAPAGGRLEAIRAAFTVSERQALRYIAQAKQKGLINS